MNEHTANLLAAIDNALDILDEVPATLIFQAVHNGQPVSRYATALDLSPIAVEGV